ncbi:MAG TPA: glycosyltransferase [Noviherbaspirillum sp.]|jgi:glycosyltransferase involved in cell wall biosynthesis|uniref:glycosyltransferase family 2 protein n=1 Tax=Noviherbaspirillum sp. TaxID=1926288 RepID=UPI002DDCF377|nr:glycosyltransferase [Noviherbaspirillum sp.]HEV2612553.1 glycosyltransferase [Noviherbaspirillum sp.]
MYPEAAPNTVSVIIPTTCELKRASYIERAIQSVLSQTGVDIELIVVVNGNRYDDGIFTTLQSDHRIKVIKRAEGNVSKARYFGLAAARGAFYCFLDDDDEFLPGAMKTRADFLVKHPDADVVVTNGYINTPDDAPLVRESAEQINKDPALAFLRSNWFASPASMFRASTVDLSLLDIEYKFFEWTYLFFLLLSNGKSIKFDPSMTYRVTVDNPLSASKSKEYLLSHATFLGSLQSLNLNSHVKRALIPKYQAALNGAANLHLKDGMMKAAWAAHLKCLMSGGWRYLPYTRRLIFPTFFRPAVRI